MTKIESIGSIAAHQRTQPGPVLYVGNRVTPRSNVVSIASSSHRRGLELVRPETGKRLLGRKGRQALARRRALDGTFLTVAMGAVVLIWWSAF